jgi:N-acetylneuraminate lyase
MKNIQQLEGLIAAPFTPMSADGALNLAVIPNYYAFLKQNDVRGAFICGSTGEGVSLTLEEKKAVAAAWAACTRNDPEFKIMLLLGGTCIADCIGLARYARQLDIYAVSFTAPFYFKPADAGALAACCHAVAGEVPDMPFYYYHIPVLTGVDVPMIELLKAVDGLIPNFAGVKYTHEDLMDFLACRNYQRGKYDMLWGRDETMLPALAAGAKGAVGSTFNYLAPLYHRLIDSFQRNELETARDLQQTSIDFIRLLGKYGGIATGKAYMKIVGLDCGGFRLPVKNMDAAQFEAFRAEVLSLPFDVFKSRWSITSIPVS